MAFPLAWVPSDRDLAQHDEGVATAEVTAQGRLVAWVVQVEGVLHIVPEGKSGNRSSGLMARACGICLQVMAFLVEGAAGLQGYYTGFLGGLC